MAKRLGMALMTTDSLASWISTSPKHACCSIKVLNLSRVALEIDIFEDLLFCWRGTWFIRHKDMLFLYVTILAYSLTTHMLWSHFNIITSTNTDLGIRPWNTHLDEDMPLCICQGQSKEMCLKACEWKREAGKGLAGKQETKPPYKIWLPLSYFREWTNTFQ